MKRVVTQHLSDFRQGNPLFFSGLVSTSHQGHTQLVLVRVADHGPLQAASLEASFALVHLLVHARIAHLPTVWIDQERNPAAKSHDVVVELGTSL